MSDFLNLTPQKSKGLDNDIYANAIKLRKDALYLANESKSFSTATSILILSLEETIKAILILLHSEEYKIYKLPDSRLFFRDHKIRHGVAKMLEMGFGLFEASEIWEKQKEKPLIKKDLGLFSALVNSVNNIAKTVEPLLKSERRIKKIQEFNILKNKGFYVDYSGGLVIPAESVTENNFIEVNEITDRIFKSYKKLKEVFDTIPENNVERKELTKVKKDLRLFIDDAIKDFSIKELNRL